MEKVLNSKLWEQLESQAKKEDEGILNEEKIAEKYISAVKDICKDAVDRAGKIDLTFPMYTSHDETHISNVLKMMANLLGKDGINKLSRDETAMLILSACCHDIGMSYKNEEQEEVFEDKNRFEKYLETRKDYFVRIYSGGKNKQGEKLDYSQIDGDIKRNFFRSIHHDRVEELLLKQEWDSILRGKVDKKDLIRVCKSHGEDHSSLDSLGKNKFTGVDLRFCAILLRLADILDFDTSRAPKAVYDYCGFDKKTDDESILSKDEWDKHMSSDGFKFPEELGGDRTDGFELQYSAECKSIQVEHGISSYIDWVDNELKCCGEKIENIVGKWQNFRLPDKVYRTITIDGYVSGEFKFTMDQERILELFTGERLYDGPCVFVRELIQNAIDAVRTREKVFPKSLDRNWKGQINIRSWQDEEGYHWFRIEDNGTGMDEDIILNHLLKVGNSYYTSSNFEYEKIQNEVENYTPISFFGIGLLSCFLGDKNNIVEISTKRIGEYTPGIRLRLNGAQGYYYMARSDRKDTNPGEMKGITNEEKKPYLQKPGTVIAVRANLYQMGKYSGFKEVVDKYVLCPEVPIRYEEDNVSFDYMTEKEFMNIVHSISPSDDPEKDGVFFEHELSEDEIKEMRDEGNLLELEFEKPPKIVLKAFALDKYTDSPSLSGMILGGKIINREELTSYGVRHEKHYESLIILLKDGKIYAEELGYNKKILICELSEFEWYKSMQSKIGRTLFENNLNTISNNGVFCDTSGLVYGLEEFFSSVILLRDKYCAELNVARNNINKYPLEALCDFSIIHKNLTVQGVEWRIDSAESFVRYTLKEYDALLSEKESLGKNLKIDTNKNTYSIEYLEDTMLDEDEFLKFSFPWDFFSEYDINGIYSKLCFVAVAKKGFALKFAFEDFKEAGKCNAYIVKQEESADNTFRDFPPLLFVQSKDDNYACFAAGFKDNFPSAHYWICNANHPLSQFILNNSELLQKYAPRILSNISKILLRYRADAYELKRKLNKQLEFLRKIKFPPDAAINIPDTLFLTDDDFDFK